MLGRPEPTDRRHLSLQRDGSHFRSAPTLGYKRASWMRVELGIQEAEGLVKTGQEKGISNEAKMQQGNRQQFC